MKKLFVMYLLLMAGSIASAQSRYMTRNGKVTFFSTTPLEDIKADNNQASCIIDVEKGEMAFTVLMKSFVFPKALMQEHFNENYVESDKFPKASFKGSFAEKIPAGKDGVYTITSTGELFLHGVSKPVQATGTVEVKEGKLYAKSKFIVSPKDYDISIPKLVENNIAKNIEVSVDVICDQVQ